MLIKDNQMFIVTLIVILMPIWLFAMDNEKTVPKKKYEVNLNSNLFLPDGVVSTIAKNDGSQPDIVYVRGKGGYKVPETYEDYYCSLADTASIDDERYLMHVKQNFFVQLCVQASKAHGLDMQSFRHLVQKIKVGIIDKNAQIVQLTEKDLNHRLLSYIPYGRINVLVNDKKFRLMFLEKTKPIAQKLPADDSADRFPYLFPENPADGFSFKGCDREYTGEKELVVFDYDFALHPAHHAGVVEAFNKLVSE